MSAKELTGKQRAFVRAYTTVGPGLFNMTQAAKLAGYTGGPNTLAVTGRENLRKPHINKAIRLEFAERYHAADITVDRILNDIELTRQLALQAGQFSAALRASELHGKYLKMFMDRVEHIHTLDDVSTEDLIALASRVAKRIDGLDFSSSDRGDAADDGVGAPAADDRKPH